MSRRNTDHVVFDGNRQMMVCRHCGAEQALNFPMAIGEAAGAMGRYVEEHKACQPASEPDRNQPDIMFIDDGDVSEGGEQ